MKRKIKVLPLLVAMVTSTGSIGFVLDKSNSATGYTVFKDIDDDILDEKVKLVYDFPRPINITTSRSYVTTTTTSTTTTTVTTTESKYKDILFLSETGYSLDNINGMIIKYSGYCNLEYNQCVSILNDNYDLISNYSSLEEGIMRVLFDCSGLSCYCNSDCKVIKSMDRDQMEAIMLNMCDVMCISNDDKKIILSIFRWETGHGTSDLCVYNNNYGGIRVYNGEFGIYQTPEYGMYRAIECMYGHICRARNNGCSDIYSIISYISTSYCPGTADAWTSSISGMTYSVSNYYDFESGYVKKYE